MKVAYNRTRNLYYLAGSYFFTHFYKNAAAIESRQRAPLVHHLHASKRGTQTLRRRYHAHAFYG